MDEVNTSKAIRDSNVKVLAEYRKFTDSAYLQILFNFQSWSERAFADRYISLDRVGICIYISVHSQLTASPKKH